MFAKGIITGMKSEHHNGHEDRRWRLYYAIPDGFRCAGGRKYRANRPDKPMDFTCPPNHAISGVRSRHINHFEDRLWGFRCCPLKGRTYDGVRLTGDINTWDGPMDFKCLSNEVLVGVKSRHHNLYEDRIWQARCATLLSEGQVNVIGEHTLTEYVNYWDGKLDYTVSSGYVITGLASVHSNWHEDRRFKIYSASLNIPCRPLDTSVWINQYDGLVDFRCQSNSAMIGLKSVHHNHYEDRRFMFRCCDLSNGGEYTIESHLTEYVNSYDGKMDKTCPNNDVLVGLISKHSNSKEDRRFRFYCGSIIKA